VDVFAHLITTRTDGGLGDAADIDEQEAVPHHHLFDGQVGEGKDGRRYVHLRGKAPEG